MDTPNLPKELEAMIREQLHAGDLSNAPASVMDYIERLELEIAKGAERCARLALALGSDPIVEDVPPHDLLGAFFRASLPTREWELAHGVEFAPGSEGYAVSNSFPDLREE